MDLHVIREYIVFSFQLYFIYDFNFSNLPHGEFFQILSNYYPHLYFSVTKNDMNSTYIFMQVVVQQCTG